MCVSVLESLCVSQLTNVSGSKVTASVYIYMSVFLLVLACEYISVCVDVSFCVNVCVCVRAHAHPPMCCSTFLNRNSDEL